jgi:hypothetical protein
VHVLHRIGIIIMAMGLLVAACGSATDGAREVPLSTNGAPAGAGDNVDTGTATGGGDDVTDDPDRQDPGALEPVEDVTPLDPGTPLDTPKPDDAPLAPESAMLPSDDGPLVTAARIDLAALVGVDPDDIELVSMESVTWRNGSLGCPQEGYSYTQALVPGHRIVLRTGSIDYHYHNAGSLKPFLCENPVGEPLPPEGGGDA